MDADDVASERPQRSGGQHHGNHRSGCHPIALRVVDRGEGIAVGLLFAEVSANGLGITVPRKGAVRSGSFGDAPHPVAAVPLRQQPSAEGNLGSIIVILLDHVHASMVAAACHRLFVHAMFLRIDRRSA
ncbi:hypothetical protein [Sphingomonas sp. UBA978]|uniref:hypothetical protein n=1 Tax=Sphingomonas sp. UBA978 TaxID=1947536 RepID=UPI0025E4B0B2|nr:hypothetical protein [Sphingomonas sp. UBA978]